jgi:hypothetical protein
MGQDIRELVSALLALTGETLGLQLIFSGPQFL